MASLPQGFPRYTKTDYLGWKGDWELWDGIPIAMAPSPFGRHQATVMRLGALLIAAAERVQCHATVVCELDWIVTDDTVVRPDVMLICGDPPEGHQQEPPAMVIEVLSQGTKSNDLGYKKDLYREHGVGVYWVADPINETVQAISMGMLASSDDPTMLVDPVRLACCKDCNIKIDPALFWPAKK